MVKKKRSLDDQEMTTERPIGRRSSMAAVGAGVLGAAALVAGAGEAEAQCSDRDPNDPAGRGRWCRGGGACSDRDPNDPVGAGRRCGGGGYGVCSDADPYDPAGRGRRCGRRVCSDSDPYDPAGAGRHC